MLHVLQYVGQFRTDAWRRPAKRWSTCVFAAAAAFVLFGHAAQALDSIALPGENAFPESLTATADGTLYVGSIADGGVMRVPPGAIQAEPWIRPGAFGSRSIFGVLADKRSNTLWACSNDVSALGIKGPSEAKGSNLLGFDLTAGDGKVSATLPGPQAFCNDIAVGPDGSAFVTNTAGAQIYRLPPNGKALEVWVSDPLFEPKQGEGGLDGITFGRDGNMYVTTFTRAEVFRIEVKDGKAGAVTRLTPTRPLVLADEMRLLPNGSILMIEGGGRLDRVTLAGDTAQIEVLQDVAGGPTGVAVVGDVAWVSVGQLAALFQPGKNGRPKLPFRLVGVPLR